jgi:hypothetical protein
MSFPGNFQRPNPPNQPPPALSEEEKALAEKKRRFDEDLKKAQADLKRPGMDAFVSRSALQKQAEHSSLNQKLAPVLKPEALIGLLLLVLFILAVVWIGFLLVSYFRGL